MIDISIVIPVYNSSEILSELVKKIYQSIKDDFNFEIILINDKSADNSWDKIKELTFKYKNLQGINLEQNYGQHNAIMAGLNNVKGKYIVMMDDDLQHPPENIKDIVAKLKEGNEVCYVKYINRKHAKWKIFVSWLNNIISSLLISKPIGVYTSSFKGITKSIKNEIIKYKKPQVFIDWLILRETKKISTINVHHLRRYSGKTNYSFKKLMLLWSNMVIIIPILPLRFSSIFLIVSKIIVKTFIYRLVREKNPMEQYIIKEKT